MSKKIKNEDAEINIEGYSIGEDGKPTNAAFCEAMLADLEEYERQHPEFVKEQQQRMIEMAIADGMSEEQAKRLYGIPDDEQEKKDDK